MKKNVRIFALILAALMLALCFSACGSSDSNGNKVTASDIKKASDMKGKKIAVVQGYTGETCVQELGYDYEAFKKGTEAIQELKNGKCDVVVIDSATAQKYVADNPELTIVEDPEAFADEKYAIAVKKGDTELLNKINASIEKMLADGTISDISAAYIDETGYEIPQAEGALDKGTIKFGTNAEFPPFEFVNSGKGAIGEYDGIDMVMAKMISESNGMTAEIENMEFDSLILALKNGQVDAIIAGMTITEERAEEVDFSTPYYTATQVMIVRK